MSAQISRLFGVIVLLFALLVVFTTRWTVIDKASLDNNSLNRLTLVSQLRIKRGRLLANDGTVLAKSVPAGGGTWKRVYPTGPLFAQAVGYSNVLEGSAAGLELSDGSDLRGLQTGLGSIFGQLSPTRTGDDVYTTLDPKAQRAAMEALGSQEGSVVALNPRNGAVLVMYSNPSYNDNGSNPCGPKASGTCFNRATQASYAPGSTFKTVTATAGIDSGLYTPDSEIDGKSPLTVSGVPLENDGNQDWGLQTLTTAMINSINTIFAQVAERVGRGRMADYMKRFGFYSKPPLDYPPSEMRASDVVSVTSGKALPPGSGDEDIGRIGIGEGGVSVTPLQMAMVAAAIANGGKLMTPHLTARVVNADGVTVKTISPSVFAQVMSPRTAREVTDMMTKVVEEGTGTTVQFGGISIAGKTGTASIGAPGENLTQPSFLAFAPANDPKVAIDVIVDRSQGGYGATVAGPIARAVLQTLLSEGR
ncbi:MAG TPA: penicillin-binding protein 2 [Solirubrobacteraceae bacterium]|nr:penicillin-binding protein 2 [Solirubrobacteraceae bacterium]